ncbi:hypothetical protein BY996DRAFT_4574320 [Phakopsora pachyrhizi]|nr:hypothetical protein BY996DRAFT_4574320 [Phakopsora pachyrhizi]
MAGFCRRCGDIIRGTESRCKCGGSSAASKVTKAVFEPLGPSPKQSDRWLKKYGERRSVSPAANHFPNRSESKPQSKCQKSTSPLSNLSPRQELTSEINLPMDNNQSAKTSFSEIKNRDSLGERSLNTLPSTPTVIPASPQLKSADESLMKNSQTIKEVKRGLSVKSSARAHVRSLTADMPDSVDLSPAEEEVLTNVFGSVLDPHETRGRCGACQKIFKREGKIYPDPRREDESGTWAGVFYCRSCYVERFSRGTCGICSITIVGDEGFIQLGKAGGRGLWHKKCFRCVNCAIDISQSPSVDLRGDPCCDDCFDKPRKQTSGSCPGLGIDIPDLRIRSNPRKTTTTNESPVNKLMKPTMNELRTKLHRAGIEKELSQSIGNPSNSQDTSSSHLEFRSNTSQSSKRLSLVSPIEPLKRAQTENDLTLDQSKNSIKSASSQHVLSPSANPLCPTCNLPLFRPKPYNSTRNKLSENELKDNQIGTLATLPDTGETFHVECLTCDDCKNGFPGNRYIFLNSQKLCETCVTQRDLIKAQQRLEKIKSDLEHQHEISIGFKSTNPVYLSKPKFKPPPTQPIGPSFPNAKGLGHSTSFTSIELKSREDLQFSKNQISSSTNLQKTCINKVSSSPFLNLNFDQKSSENNQPLPSPTTVNQFRRFGGQSICPGCSKPGTITETKLGPNSQRWHSKCLRCSRCSKILDSGAKLFENGTNVGCRCCIVEFIVLIIIIIN